MDLPICPACGQSVLDDDVDDCPFCGASLSGKPPATPPAATAAVAAKAPAPSPPAATRATPAQTQESEPASPTPAGEDDPFELERSAEAAKPKQVVKLHARPEPGRRHKVACPMCESVGYTARKAAGRDVRCVNPDCEFPVFTAPPLAEGESVSDEPGEDSDASTASRTFWSPMNIGVTAALGIAGVSAICFFVLREKPVTPGQVVVDPPPKPNKPTPPKTGRKIVQKKQAVDPAERSREIRSGALTMMAENAGGAPPHLKPLSWHWTVDAHAQAGQVQAAREHLRTLRNVTSRVPHFAVQPLVTLAWHRCQAGAAEGLKQASKAADEALKAAANPPALSRDRYDVAAQLSAVLLAIGRNRDAGKLIAENDDASGSSRMSLFLHRVEYLEQFNADAALNARPFRRPKSPLRVSVVLLLAAHGEWEAARTFAASQSDERDRAACLLAWHESAAALRKSTDRERLDALTADTKQLSAADLATVCARVAVRLHRRGETEGAARFLAKARQALPSEKPPPARKTPTIEGVLNYKRLNPSERIRRLNRAAAFGELARAEVQIDPKRSAASWAAIARALAWCRSVAPPSSAVGNLLAQTRPPNDDALRARFALQYPNDNENEIANKFRRYQMILTDNVKPDTDAPFTLQSRILQGATQWNPPALLTEVWAGLRKPAESDAQDWFATTVPWVLATQADLAGRPALRAEIREALKTRKLLDARQFLQDRVLYALRDKHYSLAGRMFGDKRVDDSDWKNRLLYVMTARLVDSGDLTGAETLVRAVRAPFAQLTAFNLLAARAVELGKTEELWRRMRSEFFAPPAKVALCHGLVSALRIPKVESAGAKRNSSAQ